MSTNSGRLVSARLFIGLAAEPGKAAQLCVFVLCTQYLCLGVFVCVWIWVRGMHIRQTERKPSGDTGQHHEKICVA